MTEFDKHDMNETVRGALIESAPRMPFAERTRRALSIAAASATLRRDDAPRLPDLLAQTIAFMSEDLRNAGPVHVARQEIFSDPARLAHAFLADAAERWVEGDPRYDPETADGYLAAYEATDPDHHSDAETLDEAARHLEETLRSE